MTTFRNAPAIIVWAFALVAILTPPEIAASGIATLLEAQEHVFGFLVDAPAEVAELAPELPARA